MLAMLILTAFFYIAGETPLCIANSRGECSTVRPSASEYCAGQGNSTDCPRFQDFEALFMRGEAHLGQRKEEATAATNSLVFNAFIWLQVCSSIESKSFSTASVQIENLLRVVQKHI